MPDETRAAQLQAAAAFLLSRYTARDLARRIGASERTIYNYRDGLTGSRRQTAASMELLKLYRKESARA